MNINQIIGKLMGDGSIGEEKSALDAWKKETQENIKALEEIQKIAALSNALHGYQDFDTENAWDTFSSKLETEKSRKYKTTNQTTIFSIKNISRIAAILVVVVGSIFLINQFINPSVNVDEAETYSAALESLNFDLTDGTNITLDKKSDLKVISERNVVLLGRAHFDIKKDASKSFSIELPVGKIVVLGTEFTIDADEETTEVYVEEGSVRYELEDRTFILVAGDLVKVSNNEVTVLKGRIENYDSWKNQRLIFRDNNMAEVVDALARHFKQEIIIENEKDFAKCNVWNVFTNSTLNDILNGLSKTHGLKYELRDNKVFIVSAKC